MLLNIKKFYLVKENSIASTDDGEEDSKEVTEAVFSKIGILNRESNCLA